MKKSVQLQASNYSISVLILMFLVAGLLLLQVNAESIRLSKADIERLGNKYGARAKRRLENWQNLLTELAREDERYKLERVNNFFNQIRFVSDVEHWGKEDYWATPVEFLITNGGDCEDFTIAKYYTLKELGIAAEKMTLSYVKSLEYNQAHMVLTYYATPQSIPLVLDNIRSSIMPASKRRDLVHVYSFNGEKLWLTKMGKRTRLVGTSDRLKPWVRLKSRIDDKDVGSK